ncbi:MAG: glycogen-binding domain-containing protein [Calditerrivibrio sp.]|nr:glycogen-binding domain-containing protein [Calditerrivibrio sp.]
MKEVLISQFIDDELSLVEKREFVVSVRGDDAFYRDTLEMIDSEMLVRSKLEQIKTPEVKVPSPKRYHNWLMAAVLLLGLLFLVSTLLNTVNKDTVEVQMEKEYRFVLYDEHAKRIEIFGTFTNWDPVPMKRVGGSNYWEITLRLPKGEHRYSFIADGRIIADPTASFIEKDDFGNVNSVLEV